MSEQDEAADRRSWPQLEAANWIEMLAYLGTSPLAESHLADDLTWVITGVFDNTHNGVAWARLTDADADRSSSRSSIVSALGRCLSNGS